MKNLYTIFLLITFCKISLAQDIPTPSLFCDNDSTKKKTIELINAKRTEGFLLLEGGFYQLDNNSILPIMVHLDQKTIYHFLVVGQTDLDFLEVGLGHEAFGTDEVQDRIRKNRDHTYFTNFTYVPPFSGNYLLSVTERCKGKKKFSTAIYLMVKPKKMNLN